MTDPRPKKTRRQKILTLILENEASPNPLSPVELAHLYGLNVDSIYRVMTRLRRDGRIKGGDGPDTHHKGGRPIDYEAKRLQDVVNTAVTAPGFPLPTPSLADIDAALLDSHMTLAERMEILTRWARSDSPMISMTAISKLGELDRGRGTHVGPPEPLNSSERSTRLAALMSAMGREEVDSALLIAFPEAQDAQNTPPSSEPTNSGDLVG